MDKEIAQPDKEFIQSLEKGLIVLKAFSQERPAFTLAEMARTTGLSRAAARRVVLTLQSMGYVGTDGREYHLLPRVLELGHAYLDSFGLSEVARPLIESLNAAIGEACSVGVLDGTDVVYIARAQGIRRMTTAMALGTRLDASCTAVGRVLLANLSPEDLDALIAAAPLEAYTEQTITDPDQLRAAVAQTREQGWAIVDQEIEVGFRTAAAPIHDPSGNVIAGLNVGMHTARVSLAEVRDVVLPQLLSTANAISEAYARKRATV